MGIEVSIIIPIYNCEKYIENCIESLLNQTIKECEYIFINDGSTDGTKEILEKYQKENCRIKVYEQSNSGPSKARNIGIEKAIGKYLVFVDADDTISQCYVEKLLEAIYKNNYDIVSCGYVDISKYGILNLNDFWYGKEELNKGEFIKSTCNGVGGVLWGKIFKRDIIINNDIRMDSKVFMSEDLLFILEYIIYANKFGVIEESLYNYNRLNENSISSNININYLENYKIVIDKMKELLLKLNVREELVDSIVISRIQSLITNILISESNVYLIKKDKQHFINNVTLAIDNSFLNDYISKLKDSNKINKIQNRYIRDKEYSKLLYINITIILMKKLKDKILRRV